MVKRPVVTTTAWVLYIITALVLSQLTHAQIRVTTPTFPSCSNPQGQTVASYTTGIHGIPGDYSTHTGSDTVYNLTDDTLTQCFCAENGDGIQTNWWKVSSLSIEEVEYLQNLGWIYIPNGADWGLQQAPYLAHNNGFDCDPGDNKDDGDDDDDDDDDNDDDSDDNDGDVLGISTIGQVLGLAATGNLGEIALLGLSATISLGTGIYLIKKANDKS